MFVPAIQDQSSCDDLLRHLCEFWPTLWSARVVLTKSYIGQVLISVSQCVCCRRARLPACGRSTPGELSERPSALARTENPSHARREGSSSSSEEWHGRGVDPSCQKERGSTVTGSLWSAPVDVSTICLEARRERSTEFPYCSGRTTREQTPEIQSP